MTIYKPIVKLKKNDVQSLNLLGTAEAKTIAPIFEMLRPGGKIEHDKHLINAIDALMTYKQPETASVDLTLFKPDTIFHGVPAAVAGYKNILQHARKVIPVVSTVMDSAVWPHMKEIVSEHDKGVCFRLFAEDITELAPQSLELIQKRSLEMGLIPNQVDILLDFASLRHLNPDDVTISASRFLRAVERSKIQYRQITLAGSSLVDFVSEVAPEHGQGEILRKELGIWLRTSQSYGWHRGLKFADYGTVRPGHVDGGPLTHMNGKVRYTAGNKTYYFRGCSREREKIGDQLPGIAQRLISSPIFKGSDFSWGDKFIARVATGQHNSADLGNWVCWDMNHHLTYACRQLREALRLAEAQQPAEAIETAVDAF